MDIRPLHDRVVVKRIEEGETMQGGLYIPDSAKEKPQQGEVVATGNGKRTEDGTLVEVKGPIAPGERVIVRGAERLEAGEKVHAIRAS